MAQVINTNVASLNSQRQLAKSQSALNQSLERLSSGLRINSAKDDAAGLAISDRMTSQINGLNQAARNANDGISLAQTAEGGLTSIGDSLQRLRALAVQSANSSNSASDRAAINNEAKTLLAEISRVASATQFNGTNLLDGSFSSSQFQVGANANQTISMGIGGASTTQIGAYQQKDAQVIAGAFTGANLTITADGSTNAVTIGASAQSGTAGNNLITADSAAAKALAINAKTVDTGVSATASTTLTAASAPNAHSGSLQSGDLLINGVSIGAISGSDNAVTQGKTAATAINAQTQLTGVTAVADASTGKLTLTAADGRNITIASAAGTADGVTAIQNVTGLDASTGAAAATGHDTMTLQVANTFAATGATAGHLSQGDSFTLDGITYQYSTTAAGVSAGKVGIIVADAATAATVADATRTAINAQYDAGNTSVHVTSAAGGATLTIENNKLGASNTFANYSENVTGGGGAGALVQASTGTGTDVAEGDTLTLTTAAYTAAGNAGDLQDGDTFTLDGLTYEYDTDTTVGAGNVVITLGTPAANTVVGDATRAAINAEYVAGRTTVHVTSAAGSAALTLTNNKLGSNNTTVIDNASDAAGLTVGVTTAGTTAATVDTYGKLTLSSATGFKVSGSEAATAGLLTGSANLTTLSTVDLSTVEGANDAISILDGALSQVDTLRADLGAAQNRFTSVVSNLTTSSENLSASRSRIQDADFAAETAIMSKNNILQQAGTAMLAQANSLPQQVLSLLK